MKSFTKKSILFLFFTVLFKGFMPSIYAQNVLVVDNSQGAGAQYTSLQTAINAASPGDIIYVQPSPDHYESITITKQLIIYGMGHNPELNAGNYARVLSVTFDQDTSNSTTSSNSKIAGLVIGTITVKTDNIIIENNKLDAVRTSVTQANNCIISGNIIENANGGKFQLEDAQNWIISNNIINHTLTNGNSGTHIFSNINASIIVKNNIIRSRQNGDSNGNITFFLNANGGQIYNNIFLFTGTGVINFAPSNLNFQNNLTYSYNSTLSNLPGTNNIDNTNPLLVSFSAGTYYMSSLSNDFHLQTGSPAIGAGNDGLDLGIYNGDFPFNMRGHPTMLPYLTSFTIYNTNINAGSSLNINVKANANITN